MNEVLFVLPDSDQADHTWQRILRLAEKYFPEGQFKKVFSARIGSAASRRPEFSGRLIPFEQSLLRPNGIVVVAEELESEIQVPESMRRYALQHRGWHVLIRLLNQAIEEQDYAKINAHAYNRYADKNGVPQFFPYGHIFRETGLGGPLNEFGFRIESDNHALIKRSQDHKVVAFIGGSSVWGFPKFHDETIPCQLENIIQEYLNAQGGKEKVTVVNFGLPISVVLSQSIVYLLHVERLNPDLVISHDGLGDILYGLCSEKMLLDHDITAPNLYENWAHKLHNREDINPRLGAGAPIAVVNSPEDIARAYLNRKLQLDRVIRSGGARHLLGFQPFALSKSALSCEEEANLTKNWSPPDGIGHWFPIVADLISNELRKMQGYEILDCHKAMERFGAETTMFQDFAHTVPVADQFIAQMYADKILSRSLLSTEKREGKSVSDQVNALNFGDFNTRPTSGQKARFRASGMIEGGLACGIPEPANKKKLSATAVIGSKTEAQLLRQSLSELSAQNLELSRGLKHAHYAFNESVEVQNSMKLEIEQLRNLAISLEQRKSEIEQELSHAKKAFFEAVEIQEILKQKIRSVDK